MKFIQHDGNYFLVHMRTPTELWVRFQKNWSHFQILGLIGHDLIENNAQILNSARNNLATCLFLSFSLTTFSFRFGSLRLLTKHTAVLTHARTLTRTQREREKKQRKKERQKTATAERTDGVPTKEFQRKFNYSELFSCFALVISWWTRDKTAALLN